MPSEATLAGFRSAVSILFKPGECPVTIVADRSPPGSDIPTAEASIRLLDEVSQPESLPPYWTLSVPCWYHPDMGNLDIAGYQHTKKLNQVVDGAIDSFGCVQPGPEVEVYNRAISPFLVFESDDLMFHKDQHPTDEDKTVQKNAMAHAFLASGFPFAVLVDSGSKSVHATVRLDDDFDTIKAWRESVEFQRLQDLALVVFGDYDKGVLKEVGGVRLVRTPGAMRENGKPQSIIATGRRTTILELTKWFADQLNSETQKEVWGRHPITDKVSLARQTYLRLEKWRADLVKPHSPGERGTHWFHVSKSLMLAGCTDPKLLLKPSPQVPCGQWQASWLWHVSAYIFNHYSKGWFFSHDSRDWASPGERTRWDGESSRQTHIREQLKYEGVTDPARADQNSLLAQWLPQVEQPQALPLPPQVGPPVHTGGVTGATLTTDPNAKPGEKPKKEKKKVSKGDSPYDWCLRDFAVIQNPNHLIKCSSRHGDSWYVFNPVMGIWKEVAPEYIRSIIQDKVFGHGTQQKHISEVYSTIANMVLQDEPWVEYPNAIAFLNGTLYIDSDGVEFKPKHDPADRLRSLVPCHYDPAAQCPRWENFIRWALPDPSRLSLLQEAFGYTLIPGQPFQSFFMMTGTGSNGKSVVLAVLQALHKDSFETVALANLGGRFSLGTLGRKRLAIDTEAENVVNAVSGEGNSATAILKSWTGGDPVKIEAKRVQGWSETINAKYFMSCNKKPRFVDPTKGVWRRLKLLKFEASIDERQADVTLGSKLINQELPGIVNWAVNGLRRLYAQNGFTQSDSLRGDLAEYQIDSDSVALFVQDFMRLAVGDSAQAWFDIRPFHKAYRDRCLEAGNSPVSETEFRQRLEMLNVVVGRPGENEAVNGCPAGFERAPGLQHWSIRGWRCYHPAYTTQSLVGSYTQAQSIQSAPIAMQGAR